MEPIKKTNKVNNFFRSNLKKITGVAASEKEIKMLNNSIPSMSNSDLKSIKGTISEGELKFIKKLIPNIN